MMFEYNKLDEMLKNASLNYNTRPVEKFENYSPSEMSNILNHSLEDDSIINFRNDFSRLSFKDIPFFNSIKYFLSIINREGEIKLTAAGNFPPKYIKELYSKSFIDDASLENKSVKALNEMDIPARIRLSRSGGAMAFAIGEASRVDSLHAQLWIEQENFALSKIRLPSGAEVAFSDYATFGNILYPKTKIVSWAHNQVQIKVRSVTTKTGATLATFYPQNLEQPSDVQLANGGLFL